MFGAKSGVDLDVQSLSTLNALSKAMSMPTYNILKYILTFL